MKAVALIPARAGSKRIPKKAIKPLNGHPLIAYTIAAALESDVFHTVAVCSDDKEALKIGERYGAHAVIPRDPSADDEADIEWVSEMSRHWFSQYQIAAILRPTSPFRTAATIRRAMQQFRSSECHSLRAVQIATENPYKMWRCPGRGYPMTPILDQKHLSVPLHSQPSQNAGEILIQNASLEIVWTWVVKDQHSISGTKVIPFFTQGHEGFDLNTMDDWAEAERIAAAHPELLPPISVAV